MEEQMFSLSSRSPVCFWPAREKVMAVKEGVFSSFHSHFLHSAAWMVNLLIKPSALCVSAVSCWQTRSYTKKERGEDERTSGCFYQSQTATNTFQEGEFVHVPLCTKKSSKFPPQSFQGDVRINSDMMRKRLMRLKRGRVCATEIKSSCITI